MEFPLVFAHRGAHYSAPENSLPAFEQAFELGCDGIEVDVRFSADGEIFVFHDRNTLRLTGIRGNIQKMTTAEIRSLTIKTNGRNNGEKIPLLSEVLELAGQNRKILIDVKKESLSDNGFEEALLHLLKMADLNKNILISSFNPTVLKRIGQSSSIHTGFIFRNRTSMMMLNGQPVKSLHARHSILSHRYIEQLRNKAPQIFAWTVDEPEKMEKMIHNGVDAIITNQPNLLLNIKKNRS